MAKAKLDPYVVYLHVPTNDGRCRVDRVFTFHAHVTPGVAQQADEVEPDPDVDVAAAVTFEDDDLEAVIDGPHLPSFADRDVVNVFIFHVTMPEGSENQAARLTVTARDKTKGRGAKRPTGAKEALICWHGEEAAAALRAAAVADDEDEQFAGGLTIGYPTPSTDPNNPTAVNVPTGGAFSSGGSDNPSTAAVGGYLTPYPPPPPPPPPAPPQPIPVIPMMSATPMMGYDWGLGCPANSLANGQVYQQTVSDNQNNPPDTIYIRINLT